MGTEVSCSIALVEICRPRLRLGEPDLSFIGSFLAAASGATLASSAPAWGNPENQVRRA